MKRLSGSADLFASRAAEEWWRRYLVDLGRCGVREQALPWYRRRVEQLLRRHPGQTSHALASTDIQSFLVDLETQRIPVWQLLQCVDALDRFGRAAGANWWEQVDWAWWRRRFADEGPSLETVQRGRLPTEPALRTFAERLRCRGYSLRTERSYRDWVQRCADFHGVIPGDLDERHIGPYLTWLAGERQVSPSTQRQALCALVLFFQEVLDQRHVTVDQFQAAQRPRQVPTVLSRDEVARVLQETSMPLHRLALAL